MQFSLGLDDLVRLVGRLASQHRQRAPADTVPAANQTIGRGRHLRFELLQCGPGSAQRGRRRLGRGIGKLPTSGGRCALAGSQRGRQRFGGSRTRGLSLGLVLALPAFEIRNQRLGTLDRRPQAVDLGLGLGPELARRTQYRLGIARLALGFGGLLALGLLTGQLDGVFDPGAPVDARARTPLRGPPRRLSWCSNIRRLRAAG